MTVRLNLYHMQVNVTNISRFIDFAFYLEDYLMNECHTSDIGSMLHQIDFN